VRVRHSTCEGRAATRLAASDPTALRLAVSSRRLPTCALSALAASNCSLSSATAGCSSASCLRSAGVSWGKGEGRVKARRGPRAGRWGVKRASGSRSEASWKSAGPDAHRSCTYLGLDSSPAQPPPLHPTCASISVLSSSRAAASLRARSATDSCGPAKGQAGWEWSVKAVLEAGRAPTHNALLCICNRTALHEPAGWSAPCTAPQPPQAAPLRA
jgi:hypothetical protein